MKSLTVGRTKKIKLLLELCFAHWLSEESQDNTQHSHKSMNGRPTILGYGDATKSLNYHSIIGTNNWTKTHS